MDDSLWHIMRVRTGSEVEVALASGVPAYVPHFERVYYNRKLRKTIRYKTPLLPGFVFAKVRAPSDVKMRPIASFYGFMRNGDGSPCILKAKAFEMLRQVERDANVAGVSTGVRVPSIIKGQKISIPSFAGRSFEAFVAEIRGDKILAEIVGSQLRVEVDASSAIAA